jgi:hypothetical protein
MDSPKNITASFINDTTLTLLYRSFTPESLALSRDKNGKIAKMIKKKPEKVEFTCFFVNIAEGANQLHVDFSRSIDTRVPFTTDPPSYMLAEESRMKKWLFTFDNPLHYGDTVYISGASNVGKVQQVTRYYWMTNGIVSSDKMKEASFTRNYLKVPMPNRINALYETFIQGGFFPTNGFIVGIARTDSPQCYGWYQTMKYNDVIKSLIISRTGEMHKAPPHGFDIYVNGRALVKGQRSLPATRYNNSLFASMCALRFNIVASAMGKIPRGFGELIYDDNSGNPLNGLMIKEIANYCDTIMMGRYNVQQGRRMFADATTFLNLDTTIQKINRSFEGAIDTISFAESLAFKGVKSVEEVPYVFPNPNAVPEVIIAEDVPMYEFPDAYTLHQNYPNPFNPSTTIGFDLPEPAIVTFRVYNMLGQLVQTVLDHVEFDEGSEEIEFTAQNLATGVYFYQLITESISDEGPSQIHSEVKKMLLMR